MTEAEQQELVWVVAEEEPKRRKIEIKIDVDVPDRLAELKKLVPPAISEAIRDAMRGALSESIVTGLLEGSMLSRVAAGTTARAANAEYRRARDAILADHHYLDIDFGRPAAEVSAEAHRLFPICGPHRSTITDRYLGSLELAPLAATEAMTALIDIGSTDVL